MTHGKCPARFFDLKWCYPQTTTKWSFLGGKTPWLLGTTMKKGNPHVMFLRWTPAWQTFHIRSTDPHSFASTWSIAGHHCPGGKGSMGYKVQNLRQVGKARKLPKGDDSMLKIIIQNHTYIFNRCYHSPKRTKNSRTTPKSINENVFHPTKSC